MEEPKVRMSRAEKDRKEGKERELVETDRRRTRLRQEKEEEREERIHEK